MRALRLFALFSALVLGVSAAPAHAVSKCKVKVDKKTGVLEVSASSVANNPLWGATPDQVINGFSDVATCFAGGKLKGCHLGAPGTPAESTPPATCFVYLADAGTDTCAARVPGCTVGLRPLVGFTADSTDPLLSLTNVGDGNAASFSAAGDGDAVYVSNSVGGGLYSITGAGSNWSGIVGYTSGSRYGGEFENLNAANPYAAIYARTAGTGQAIDAEVNANTTADALFARTTSNVAGSYAATFSGNVNVAGTLSKTAGSFQIDHPLDPEHKYLSHSFVESPDMMNVYNGNVTLGPDGTAVVVFPDWFQTLNRDFRYQLTPIGAPGTPYVAQEVANNAFTIAGAPGLRVSWQVTGIRQDPYAEAHRIPVESDKPADEVGTYLHPELYGQPRSRGRDALQHPILEPAKPDEVKAE